MTKGKMWCFSAWSPTANARRHWVCSLTKAEARRAARARRSASSIVHVKPRRETVLEYRSR
jgi:hypothetical protein